MLAGKSEIISISLNDLCLTTTMFWFEINFDLIKLS